MTVESGCPVYLFETESGIYYGFPSLDGTTAKVAEHSGGILVDGNVLEFPRELDEPEYKGVCDFIDRCLPDVQPTGTAFDVCFYTMSPDEHFILGQHPKHERVHLAAGLSGHGFKFTPVLGKALVDLAMDGKTELPVEFLSPGRSEDF